MDFSAYLTTLPPDQLTHLYDGPWTCQAVLRSLPPLHQQLVLRLVFLAAPVPSSQFEAGVSAAASADFVSAVTSLTALRVLKPRGPGSQSYALTPEFQSRLQQSILNPVSLGHHPRSASPARPAPTASADGDQFAAAQWQAVLLALVDGQRTRLKAHSSLPPLDMRRLFVAEGLLDDIDAELTADGFKFLFKDVYSQMWQLLQQYLKLGSTEESHTQADALAFLLQLSFRQVRCPSMLPVLSFLHGLHLGSSNNMVAHCKHCTLDCSFVTPRTGVRRRQSRWQGMCSLTPRLPSRRKWLLSASSCRCKQTETCCFVPRTLLACCATPPKHDQQLEGTVAAASSWRQASSSMPTPLPQFRCALL